MFYVAVGYNWCNAAPESWINKSNNTCRWPPNHASRAILEELEPDGSWDVHPLKYILGPYQSYKKAKEVEIKTEFLSADNSDMSHYEILVPDEKIKEETPYDNDEETDGIDDEDNANNAYYNYFEDENESKNIKKMKLTQGNELKQGPNQTQLPYPPVNNRPNKNLLNSTLHSGMIKLSGGNLKDRLQEIRPAYKPLTIVSEGNVQTSTIEALAEPQTFQKQSSSVEPGTSTQFRIQPTSGLHSSDFNIEAMLRSIDRKLDLILGHLNLDEITTKVENVIDQLPAFPLSTIQEFGKFCEDLEQNSELRNQFSRKIIKIGGTSGEVHLANILVATLTNGLGKQLTWEGQRETYGIKNTTYANIILWTVLQRHASATNDGITKCFREWLRRSGDRYRYHLKFGRET